MTVTVPVVSTQELAGPAQHSVLEAQDVVVSFAKQRSLLELLQRKPARRVRRKP